MKTFFKKSIALALTLLILITSIPVMNLAGVDLGFTAEATTYQVGYIIQFGSYPQSKVTNSTTISALNSKTPAWSDWTSYGYYSGSGSEGTMKQGNWMRYTDVTYNGNKYRGVKFTQYRPRVTKYDFDYAYSQQEANGFSTNTVYWFKFEPIEWRVLDPAKGLVMCETIIDAQPYSNTIYDNAKASDWRYKYFNDASYTNYASDYETSSIRKWLNNDFYNTAFTDSEKKEINASTLNNDGYYTSIGTTGYEKLDSNSTKDKIFLLSYNEARTSYFGFDSNDYYKDAYRIAKGSDYAKSQGLFTYNGDTYYGNSWWLLRSSGIESAGSCNISECGDYSNYCYVIRTDIGVRPALRLNNLETSVCKHKNQVEVDAEPYTCEIPGFTDGVYCYDCDKWISGHYYIPAPGHSLVEVEEKAPTCTEDGWDLYKYCINCNYTEIQIIKALGHYEEEIIPGRAETCTSDGYTESCICLRCRLTIVRSEIIPCRGHSFVDYVYNNDATCVADGTETAECINGCGTTYTREVEYTALGHLFGEISIYKEATCTTDAIHYYGCLNCGESYIQETYGTALGHRDYDNDDKCDRNCGLKNIYNLGEETYGFENFSDKDAKGHCFGMSVTSSAYHLGLLDSTDVGAKSNREINTLSDNEKVKKPICYYQQIQGSISNAAMVAGGTNYKDEDKRDIEADWNEVIGYVRNHKYDDSGTLQIGFRGEYTSKNGSIKKSGHAINFLRYKVVDGQERIYAYDNNYPDDEVYFYKDKDGKIKQAPYNTFDISIYSITLRKVSTYIKLTKELKTLKYFLYATGGYLGILVGTTFLMDLNIGDEEYYMYEFPEGTTTVKITPLVDNAKFMYMGQEYSFGKIDEDTYAELTLSTSEDDTPEFIIINAPEDEPEPHEHNYKSVITKPTCTTQGYTTYSCDCGESYIADIKDKLSHIESAPIKENFVNSTCTSSGSYTEVVCCSVCKFEISRNNIEIPATGHNYNNGVCTSCGDDLTANCSCNCHAGGIKGLIFKIILFFQKLFRLNQICEGCGVYHY